jgi:hypothetical protein
MNTSMYFLSVGTYVPMLTTLSQLIEKAEAQVGNEAERLVGAQLADDMFTLAQQVQQACHYAANDTCRLAGQNARDYPRVGATLGALKSQIAETIALVSGVSEDDFAGSESRDLSIDLPNNLKLEMDGSRFLRSWSLPNFYFHVVTAYDILRQGGIAIGKRDYINMADAIRSRAA